METNEDPCSITHGFEREVLYRTQAGKLGETPAVNKSQISL